MDYNCQGEDKDIVRQMVEIQNEYVNMLRKIYKDMKSKKKEEVFVYNEIIKLNNELLNSKRIIQKKNQELKKYNKLLEEIAMKDELTDCFNRRYFYDYIKKYIRKLSGRDSIITIVAIDFNNFKKVNDLYGHDIGDELLIYFAKELKEMIKEQGNLFRLGGDEFLLLFININKQNILDYMKEINRKTNLKNNIVSLAYGILDLNMEFIDSDFEISEYLIKADELMYNHKKITKTQKYDFETNKYINN
ncbi:MAG: GGDEF domain-containing protein [Peptostreptococcaceae bacterium]|nr:GGDEF domain-containing protein [Peptostreptococcaceae bacterium]